MCIFVMLKIYMICMENKYNNERRMPAEWERQDAILMALPHSETDWSYMLPEILQCYRNIAEEITTGEAESLYVVAPDITEASQVFGGLEVKYLEIQTNDTWTRDYGAISVKNKDENVIVDFKFNGWGLKFASDKDNIVTNRMCSLNAFNARRENHLSFVLEGGSIESDGKGSILTTSECLLSVNRNGGYSKGEIENYLKTTLGASRILWLNHGYLRGDDTDSHIDTLARFVDENTIAYVKCEDTNDEHYTELSFMEQELREFRRVDGEKYKLIPLPLPDAIYDENGERLPATYANFLIMNGKVIVPTYRQPQKDEFVIDVLSNVFKDREVVGVDSVPLIKQHGSVHCATMQFPIGFINKI